MQGPKQNKNKKEKGRDLKRKTKTDERSKKTNKQCLYEKRRAG